MKCEEALERLKVISDYEYDEDLQAIEMAIEALQERKTNGWNVITKRPMDAEEREEWSEELGYAITDEEAFIYSNLPEEGDEVFITTKWGSVTTDTIGYDGCFYFEEHDMEDVIAWMPLPKPYKEVEE
jgi:hypothetical protein